MKKDGYYSSGEFARMAHVTLRTIRYYDKQDILKPSFVTEAGARFYTDEDFARLQQILLLKYLGFSLDDIREMTIDDSDYHFMLNSLNIQLKLVKDKIEQMQLVEKAIEDTASAIQTEHTIDWSNMLNLIHLTNMEKSMKNQYQNASNISARISLHSLYSQNKEGWFPWIFRRVIANHVLFYCENLPSVCKEIKRVLKPGGRFICSTYGKKHMQEVSSLVQSFDERIVLSADKLYEKFGRENGAEILSCFFSEVNWISYEDSLFIPESEPLISYILSCHGNQNQYILEHYKEFRSFICAN